MAGFPDVDFRFRARLEPFDVLAVRVDQQYGDDEREHDERNQMVHFRRNERENGEAAPCDHRGQRYEIGHV